MAEEKKVTLTGQQLMQFAAQERQKLEQVNSRIAALQNFRNEMRGTKDALQEISRNEKGNKVMVNLGAGIYVEAVLEENTKAIAAIAGSVFKEKKNEELMTSLENRLTTIDKQLEGIAKEQHAVLARINQLEQVLEAGTRFMQQQPAQKN